MTKKLYKNLGISLTFGGKDIKPTKALDEIDIEPPVDISKMLNKRLKVAKNPMGITTIIIKPSYDK